MEHGLKQKIMEKVSSNNPHFPKQPKWFEDARGFNNLEQGFKESWISRHRGK